MKLFERLNGRGKVVVLFFVFVLVMIASQQAFSQFKVVGYMPSWSGSAAEIQYNRLTHINYSFIRPTQTGGLTAVDQPGKLSDIVSRAHAAGVKVGIAVGGWSDLNNQDFQTMAGNATYRQNFITALVNLINQYNLDGVDIDWEYPIDGADPGNFSTLMTELGNAMHSRGKFLTAAVAAQGYYANGVQPAVFNAVDFLNIMVYDGGSGADHSPYSYAVSSIDYWIGRQLPASKLVLGMPFYARPSWKSFRTLVAEGANPFSDTHNGDYYNGITTIKAKTNLAFDRNLGGVMFWELSQDAVGQYSLVTAIDEVVDQRTGSNPQTQSPYGGSVRNIPGTIEAEHYDLGGQGVAFNDLTAGNSGNAFRTDNVDLEATTDAGGGFNVGWIQAGEWLDYTVNVQTAGTYSLQVRVAATTAGKTFHVEMNGANISGTITVPNTGGWQNWQTVTVNTSSLTTGQKVMRIVADAGDFNINKVIFSTTTTNPPPSVSITSPANGTTYNAPASITINANASDNGSVTKVDFYNGSTLLGTDTSSPYSFTWNSVAAGTYSLTARATDNQGATTTSGAVSVTVNNTSNPLPTVSLTAPANGATYTAPASITITANASDNGSVTKVEFFQGSTKLGEDTSSPYAFTWSNVAAGTYSITARATDNQGATATSAARSVTVNGGGGSCGSVPQYVENGGYVAGSRVKNAGNQYECKPYPFTGWCNGASWAYAPGTGTYWQDAWTLIGACTAGRSVTTAEFTEEASAIRIYPNPGSGSSNKLTLTFEKVPGHVNIGMKDINGSQIMGQHYPEVKERSLEVQLPDDLPSGMYLLRVNTLNESAVIKYLKQ